MDDLNPYSHDLEVAEDAIKRIVDRLFDKKDTVALNRAIYKYKDKHGKCVTQLYLEFLIKALMKSQGGKEDA